MNPSESRLAGSQEPQPIEIRRLQIFVHAARTLCFATSAQSLYLTPSAVSHAIRALEEELSCILFDRHGPKITLTRVGVRLLPIAEDLLGRAGDLRREVSLIGAESGRLRVRVPEFLSASLLSRVLPGFFECFPAFRIDIIISDSSLPETLNSPGAVEISLGFASGETTDLVSRELLRGRFGFFVAPFHALAGTPHPDAKELARHRLLIPGLELLPLLAEAGLATHGIDERTWFLPSNECVRELARVGVGIAVIGVMAAAPFVDAGILKPLAYSGRPIGATCSAFWSKETQLSWAAEVFLSFIEMAEGF